MEGTPGGGTGGREGREESAAAIAVGKNRTVPELSHHRGMERRDCLESYQGDSI